MGGKIYTTIVPRNGAPGNTPKEISGTVKDVVKDRLMVTVTHRDTFLTEKRCNERLYTHT